MPDTLPAEEERAFTNAPTQTQAQEAKVAGVSVSASPSNASKGLIEILTFMHRLSAFEQRSSQVNLLVR